MAQFTTTIQLHKADESDYSKLNSELAKASFYVQKPQRNGGATVAAKIGEYNFSGDIGLAQVVDAVYRAIRKTGRDYSFTVMKNKGKLQH